MIFVKKSETKCHSGESDEAKEVRVTANGSCTLPTVSSRPLGPPPPLTRGSRASPQAPHRLPSAPPQTHRPAAQMDMAERGKSITRLLQHSILQLCNEHVGYSHKLQILGVLCMTVDDEQQELVVKVNNTLKRVNPPLAPTKDGTQVLQPAPPPPPPIATMPIPIGLTLDPQAMGIYGAPAPVEATRTISPNQTLPPSQAQTSPYSGSTPRKGHGRKGTNPVKVQHVYDEGDLISSEDDQDVLTVYPTDPESSSDVLSSSARDTTIETSPHPASSPRRHRPTGGTKRKSTQMYETSPLAATENGGAEGSHSHLQGAASSSSISAVRALLLGRAGQPQEMGIPRPGDSYRPSPSPEHRGLMLPLVMPQLDGQSSREQDKSMDTERSTPLYNGIADSEEDEAPTNLSMNPKDSKTPRAGVHSPSAFDSQLTIKEEPDNETGYTGYEAANSSNNNNNMTGSFDGCPEDLSQQIANFAQPNGLAHTSTISQLLTRTSDGLPTQVPYTIAFATSTPNKHQDGLSIQYTNTGPITVGKNGKNVSRPSKNAKVKDIILYDDSSPLHEQRGNRIETDYMLDSFGLEGRKRRRRNQDEALTAEEVAEYLGSLDVGGHVFTCKYCAEELHDLTQYLQHTLTLHHCYICHQCGKSFTTKSSLLRHRPIHTGMRRFACSICKKTFYRKDKCKAHIKRHLGEGGEHPEVEACEQVDAHE